MLASDSVVNAPKTWKGWITALTCLLVFTAPIIMGHGYLVLMAGEGLDMDTWNSHTPSTHPILHSRGVRSDVTPGSTWVEGQVYMNLSNFEEMKMFCIYEIHEYNMAEMGPMTADEIRVSVSKNTSLMDAMNATVRAMFVGVINYTFPTVDLEEDVRDLSIVGVNSTLVNTTNNWEDGDPYEPPIRYKASACLSLDKDAYGLEDYDIKDLNGLLTGILQEGANYLKDFSFTQDPGLLMTYTISFPSGGDILINAMGDEDLAETSVTRTIDNRNFTTGVDFTIPTVLTHARAERVEGESVDLITTIDMRDMGNVGLKTDIEVRALDISKELKKKPEWDRHVDGIQYLNADGIRCLHYNGIIDLDEVEQSLDESIQDMVNTLEDASVLEAEVEYRYQWDALNLTTLTPLYIPDAMRTDPPVSGEITFQNGSLNFFNDTRCDSEVLMGLLNSGAKVEFNITPPETKYRSQYRILLPPEVSLSGPEGLARPLFNRSWNEYLWTPTGAGSFEMYSTAYSAQKANNLPSPDSTLVVRLDIKQADIYGLNDVIARVRGEIYVDIGYISVADTEFNEDLPSNVHLRYLNSDLIRLAIYKGIINRSMFSNITKSISDGIGAALGIDAWVGEGFMGLDWDPLKDTVDSMDDEPRIRCHIGFHGDVNIAALANGASVGGSRGGSVNGNVGAGAIVLVQRTMDLGVKGVKGLKTRYIITLPVGMEFLGVRGHNGTASIGTKGGRSTLTITIPPNATEIASSTEATLGITLWFFLSKMFLPLILTAGVICGGIGLMLTKRRIKRKALEKFDKDKWYVDYALRSIEPPEEELDDEDDLRW